MYDCSLFIESYMYDCMIMLNSRLQQLERDSQMALAQEKQAHEEDVDRLTRERVNINNIQNQPLSIIKPMCLGTF